MSSLNRRVLVLNKMWQPIRVITAIRAFKLLFADKASAVNPEDYQVYNWDEWIKTSVLETDYIVKSVKYDVRVPEIIVLLKYDKVYRKGVKLTKRNIYIRDGFKCQYSGKQVSNSEADIDHVVPRSKGGRNSWDNMVVCSKQLNRKKGNRTPEQAGLKLIKKPKKPDYKQLMLDPRLDNPPSWSKFIKEI